MAKIMDPVDEIIRKNMIAFREHVGLSQAQTADLSGVPMNNLSRYERGENVPPASVLQALAIVYGRGPGDFYAEHPSPPPNVSDLDVFFLRVRPGSEVDEDVLSEVRAALTRANERLRNKRTRKTRGQ